MTTTSARASLITPAGPVGGLLPRAGSVLAVTARPGPESADLGGLVYAFRRAGASLALLCLTRGEASPLNASCTRLEAVRPWELQLAAHVLGFSAVAVASYPDGGLGRQPADELAERVRRAILQYDADLLLVPDLAAGDPDDTAVCAAVCAAARRAGVPVVACTKPDAHDAWMIDLGADAAIARAIQKAAVAAHQSQSPALPQLTRRLDLLDGREHLRWLVPRPEHMPGPWAVCAAPQPGNAILPAREPLFTSPAGSRNGLNAGMPPLEGRWRDRVNPGIHDLLDYGRGRPCGWVATARDVPGAARPARRRARPRDGWRRA